MMGPRLVWSGGGYRIVESQGRFVLEVEDGCDMMGHVRWSVVQYLQHGNTYEGKETSFQLVARALSNALAKIEVLEERLRNAERTP